MKASNSLARRLIQLGNQLTSLASEVAMSQAGGKDASAFSRLADDCDLWLIFAQEYYRDRRQRAEFFDRELFGEPAWDMLLDLYIAAKLETRVSVMSACIGSGSAPTTALRWLKVLERQGLVQRYDDNLDARRSWVELSDLGYAKMTAYFSSLRSPATSHHIRSTQSVFSEFSQLDHKVKEPCDFDTYYSR